MTLNQKLRASARNHYTGKSVSKPADMRIDVKRFPYGLFLGYSRRSGHGARLGELGLPLNASGDRYVPAEMLVDGKMPKGPAREYVARFYDAGRGIR